MNRRAHAIRRAMVEADWREAKAAGHELRWRDIAAVYDAMPAAAVLELEAPAVAPAARSSRSKAPGKPKRKAPAHVQRAAESFRLARAAWELGLEAAVAGGRTLEAGGRPARGESYPDEERDYREANPAPVYREYLEAEYAAMRADDEAAAA